MSEEYEIIHIVGEGRAVKNKKTGKIYYSEFQIIEEKNKELDQYKNNWEELKKWLNEEYDYYDKYGNAPTGCAMGEIKRTLNKMKELEGKNND